MTEVPKLATGRVYPLKHHQPGWRIVWGNYLYTVWGPNLKRTHYAVSSLAIDEDLVDEDGIYEFYAEGYLDFDSAVRVLPARVQELLKEAIPEGER